ncbi:hypothetical protein ABT354_09615 [Streptomyces sp. NPDC000594]|uniref:hypothetical protein n=1 Tax=Streptomyces sp. NPDC000594 TaxID=3154261 RepID=UPI0033268D04
MSRAVPVRCPSCLYEHLFVAPAYPCVCGRPVSPPLLPGARPERVVSRSWDDEWVQVCCTGCGRRDHWPQPELGCPCGVSLRIPVRPMDLPPPLAGPGAAAREEAPPERGPLAAGPPSHIPLPRTARAPRPSFRPPAIRTPRDAVTVAESYLRWLGFPSPSRADDLGDPDTPGIRDSPNSPNSPNFHDSLDILDAQEIEDAPAPRADGRPPGTADGWTADGGRGADGTWTGGTGAGPSEEGGTDDGGTDGEPVTLYGRGLVARIDPTPRPVDLRAVECLWLSGLTSSSAMAFFSLGGYADDARQRADELGVPLFTLDRVGGPRPVNGPAAELVSTGASS